MSLFNAAKNAHLRIARPVSDVDTLARLYRQGLDLHELYRFEDHDGFDGVMLGAPGLGWHLEFTHAHHYAVRPSPTPEDLLVFYVLEPEAWAARCQALLDTGFREVEAFNPYWARAGRTFANADGYRVVIQQAAWSAC